VAVVSGSECRLYIRGLTGTAEDTNIETIVDRVNPVVARYLGWPLMSSGVYSLSSGTYIVYLTGDGSKRLDLPIIPTTAISSIYDDPELSYDDSADLVASSDYTLYANEGIVMLKHDSTHGYWTKTPRAIKVTMTAGFSTVPQEIKQAIGLQVAHIWQARDHVGRSKVSQGGGSIEVASLGLLPEVKELLAPWRMGSAWMG
jgi:hypothetical protein